MVAATDFGANSGSWAQMRTGARLRRMTLGNLGDCRPVGHGVFELRADCGPGYRLHFARRSDAAIVLLTGDDKSSQQRDIRGGGLRDSAY